MKINKLFHWLYFCVMMLPIVVAPIFALYTTNKNATFNYEVDTPINKTITFNQLNYNGNFQNNGNLNFGGNVSYTFNDGYIDLLPIDINTAGNRWFGNTNFISLFEAHKIVFSFYYSYPQTTNRALSFRLQDRQNNNFDTVSLNFSTAPAFYSKEYNISNTIDLKYQFVFDGIASASVGNFCIFDLTLMFGPGNEPSLDEFNSLFSLPYYNYDLGSTYNLIIEDYVYSDTDIGSQFLYSMYNVVDKYFNYDNVFNFGRLYTWLNGTFFSGNAPLGFFIFWHLLIYWLLTSLLWLVFDVLMYVPQLVHRWLDKASIS